MYGLEIIKRKFYLVLSLLCCLSFATTKDVQATHALGADFSYTCLGGNQYLIRYSFYRDCAGVNAPNNIPINISSVNCSVNMNSQLNKIPGTGQELGLLICDSVVTECEGGSFPSVEEFVYEGTITLPDTCSDWIVSHKRCCRNAAINTFTNSSGFNLYIETNIDNFNITCNNSPVFSNPPSAFVCVGESFCYNHGAIDPDGDSLVYSLVNPFDDNQQSISYDLPYTASQPLTSVPPISFDSVTGDICMTPDSLGEVSAVALMVEEYRNGIRIGYVVRDIQLRVVDCNNNLPFSDGINATGEFSLDTGVCAGTPLTFTVNSNDFDTSNTITISWNNGIPGATFTVDNAQYPTATFTWVPDTDDIRSLPHCFTITVQDDDCPYIGFQAYSICVTVGGVASVDLPPDTSIYCTDSINVTAVAQGFGGFNYLWNTGETTSSIAAGMGTHIVTISDSVGCASADTMTIISFNAPIAGFVADTAVCFNDPVSFTDTSLPGNINIVSWDWDFGSGDTSVIQNPSYVFPDTLTYNVQLTVTNDTGCTDSMVQMISVFSFPVANAGNDTLICAGDTFVTLNGSVLNATSAVWFGGSGTFTPDSATLNAVYQPSPAEIASGSVTLALIATGNSACNPDSDLVTIVIASTPNLSVTGVADSCYGGSNGQATVVASGGLAPYSYLWDDTSNQTTDVATGLVVGLYNVTVTDSNTCDTSISVTITGPAPLTATVTNNKVLKCDKCDSHVHIELAGGTPPYSFEITPSYGACSVADTSDCFLWASATTWKGHKLCADTIIYSVIFTDSKGCDTTVQFTVTENPAVTANISSSTNVSCNGANDGQATVTAFGGKPPYTYFWNTLPSQSTATADSLPPGTNCVTIMDDDGCDTTLCVVITEPSVFAATVTAIVNVTCNGGNDGSATVVPSGGTAPYTYLWDDGSAQTTSIAAGLGGGTYNVTVTDSNGCVVVRVASVNEPVAFAATVGITNVSCNGGNNGLATISLSGGTPVYSYLWSTGIPQTTATASGLSAGAYTVTVSDVNACDTIIDIAITEPGLLTATINFPVNPLCNGGTDGSATATAIAGTAPYTYSWNTSPIQTNAVVTGLSNGLYSVSIVDTLGCSASASVIIIEPPALALTVTTLPANCGACDGTSTVTAVGGTPFTGSPYIYSWLTSPVQNTSTVTGLCPGNYPITVVDSNGCADIATAVISNQDVVLAFDSVTDVTCYGGSDGQASVTISSGTGPFTYQWDLAAGAQTSTMATGLQAGSYNLTVTDINGCQATLPAIVSQPLPLISNITNVDINCNGDAMGEIAVTTPGGSPPYTYSWNTSPAQSTAAATGLTAGNYTVTVTDLIGCDSTVTITLTEPPPLLIAVTSVDISCNGANDGLATAMVSGGTSSYTYLWDDSGAQTNASATGLDSGSYVVNVTDANNCNTTANVTILEPAVLAVTLSSTNINCNGACDGQALTAVSGGTSPYTYLWNSSPAQSTTSANGLCPGNYSVNITDNNGCSISANATITEPTLMTATITSIDHVACYGGNNADATATPSGGILPYSYIWDDVSGQMDSSATGLTAGSYQVTITDSNGCAVILSANISEPTQLSVTIDTIVNVSCNGADDGEAVVSGLGGTPPYTYAWDFDTTQTSFEIDDMGPGTYSVTVTDANGCYVSSSLVITEPSVLIASISNSANVSCNGYGNGWATVVSGGGSFPYTYLWDDPMNQITTYASGFEPGTYTVLLTDNNGCDTSASVTITEPPVLIADVSSSINISCNGVCDGQVVASASGGNLSYTYVWNTTPSQTTIAVTGLCPGSYTVTVLDDKNCWSVKSVMITQPAVLTSSISSINHVSCLGSDDGEATVAPSGGTAPYTYLWDDGSTQTTPTATGLVTGTYTVAVTDTNGCTSAPSSAVINEPTTAVTVTVTDSTDASCNGSNDGSVTISATGGIFPYQYLWSTTPSQNTVSATGLIAGCYTVTVTDDNGCDTTTSICIGEPLSLSVDITSTTNVNCNGDSTGQATASASGGTSPYIYSWNTAPVQTNALATGLSSGGFTVTVTDGNNCVKDTLALITQPNILSLSTWVQDANCSNADGGGSVIAVGGTAPYSYMWDGGQTTDSINGIFSGIYNVTVTDANGCLDSIAALVNDIVVFILQDSTDDLTCFGGGDGTIRISISSGTPPFDYYWSTGDSAIDSPFLTDSLTNLPGGTYTITVVDTNFCLQSAQVTIGSPQALISGISVQDATCSFTNDGTATVIVSDEIPPYTYAWSNGDTLSMADSLSVGIYTVTVTDAISCDSVATLEVFEPIVLLAVISDSMNVSCFGGSDGWATVTVSGGFPPYAYAWSDTINQSTTTASGLAAGTYSVTITDSLFCSTSATTTLSEPTLLNANIDTVQDVSCNGACDAYIVAIASGGTSAYSYFWNNVPQETSDTAIGLCPGNYKVTIVDAKGCLATDSADVTEPTVFVKSGGGVTHVTCNGGNDGTSSVSALGGTLPYTYAWDTSPVQTDSLATGLSAGTVTGTIYDANGCSDTMTAVINEPPILEASISDSTNISCFGGSDGQATIAAIGGSGVYTYLWSDPDTQITPTATGLAAGTYTVIITDGQSCDTTVSVALTEPSLLIVTVTGITNVSCKDGVDGLAVASVSGGTMPYTYLWDDDSIQVTDTAIALGAGVYTVMVTDTLGCDTSATDTITEPLLLITAISSAVNIGCKGDSTGSATVSASGGTPPYTYLWDDTNAQTDTLAVSLPADTFNVLVTDAMGCDRTISATVTEPDSLIVLFASVTNINCFGDSTGEVNANTTGGTEPYTYLWNIADTNQQTNSDITGFPIGVYTVTVNDSMNCTCTDSITLTQQTEIIDLISNDTLICLGDNATIGISASGGAGALTYTWSDPSFIGPGPFAVSPIDTTLYSVTITDSLGCNLSDSVKVRVGPVIIIFAIDDSICVGDSTTISTVVVGGDGNYSYLWETGDTTNSITINPTVSTYYTLTVDDGCATPPETDSVFVEVNPFPVLEVLPAEATACEIATIGFIDLIADIPGSVYYWDFGDGNLDTTTNPSVNYTYMNTGIYSTTVSVMSPKGCQTDSANFGTIIISPLPTADFTGVPIDSALTQSTVDFTDLSTGDLTIGDTISTWYWEFGDANSSTEQHPVNAYPDTGVFTVMLAITNEYGCPDTVIKTVVSCSDQAPSTDVIILSALPTVSCGASPKVTTTEFPTINFTSTVSEQYHWDFGDGDTISGQEPEHTYKDSGLYNVLLTVTNIYRCENTCNLTVDVNPSFKVKVPNAFTPNPDGPNGGTYNLNIFDNNVFFPITEAVEEFHMMIFNRWGELVFESFDLEIGWDGYYRGVLSQADAYAWKIELTFVNGEVVNMVGDVTLIR